MRAKEFTKGVAESLLNENVTELYHGTLAKNVPSILANGLNPTVGEFTRSIYANKAKPLVFAADASGSRGVYCSLVGQMHAKLGITAYPPSAEDVAKHCAILVISKDVGKFRQYNSTRRSGSKEPTDYTSQETIHIDRVITGKELLQWIKTHNADRGEMCPIDNQQGVAEGNELTFNQPRRQLNIPELIKRGAIFVTHPHGPNGWETDRPDWDFSLITLQNVLQKSPDWVVDYKKYINKDKKLTQNFINKLSDQKYQQILWSIKKLGIPDNVAFLDQQGVAEGFPQPGDSSGKAKQFNPNAKIQTREMTLDQILSSVKGIPYVNDVIQDWDAKDYSWGVTKKVIEYAEYLQKNPQSVANLPPLVVIDGQLNDGAHRLSAITLLQKRMDPKNPLWKQVKLKVNFGTSADVMSEQGVAEGSGFEQQAGIGIDGKSFKFQIKDLVAFANRYPVTKVNPKEFIQQIKGRDEDPTQSMARAEKADLQYPIIVVQRKNGQLWIADGTHRAHKAILNKLPTINAKVIPIDDMESFEVKKVVEAPLPPDWDKEQLNLRQTFKNRIKYAVSKAQRIGAGSSRVAFIIPYEGRNTVLKVAKNLKGLAQNEAEIQILDDWVIGKSDIVIPLIDYDKDNNRPVWLQTEMASQISMRPLLQLLHTPTLWFLTDAIKYRLSLPDKPRYLNKPADLKEKYFDPKMWTYGGKPSEQSFEMFNEYVDKLSELKDSSQIELGDLQNNLNWGQFMGRPVVIDLGLSSEVWSKYYILK